EALATAPEPPEVDAGDGDLAVIAYTAGTTAAPKGAMLSHGNLRSNLEQMSLVPRLEETSDDVVFLALPLFHIYGLNVVLGLAVRSGATIVMVDRFVPGYALDLIARHGITVLPGAPHMFSALVEVAEAVHQIL